MKKANPPTRQRWEDKPLREPTVAPVGIHHQRKEGQVKNAPPEGGGWLSYETETTPEQKGKII